MARTSWRHALTIPYQANSPIRREIDISGYIRRLWLILTGTLNVTVAGGSVPSRNPGTLVPSLLIYRNGEEVMKQGRWNDWVTRQYQYYGKIPTQVAAAAGVASYDIRSFIVIPFVTPNARNPQDTVLSLGSREKLEIEVFWADENALVNGGTKAFTTNPQIRVLAEISRADKDPIAQFKESSFETPSLGAVSNANLNIELVTGPLVNYQDLILEAEDQAATGRVLTDQINQIILQSSGAGRVEQIVGPVTGVEQQYYIDTLFSSVPGVQTGIYPVPFQGVFDGMATFNLETASLNDLRFIIDHAAFPTDGYIRVLQSIWEPLLSRG